MPFVSVTRLRLRSPRFLPGFALHAIRANRQARDAAGFRGGALLADRRWTFWTMTVWDDADAMRAFMAGGAQRVAMPRLAGWCDEASVAHWEAPDATLPGWPEAERRMRGEGRISRVRHPSPDHAAMAFAPPRLGFGGALTPRARA